MRLHQNTFLGGLDTDTTINKYSNSNYIQCKNFRVILGGKNSTGAITTIDGNREVISLVKNAFDLDDTVITIIGLSEVDSSLILVAQKRTTTYIIEVPLVNITANILTITLESSNSFVKLAKSFGFTSSSIVRIQARKETNKVRKVYLFDGNSKIFAVNLADPNIQNYSADRFEVVPYTNFVTPVINTVIGGALNNGRVQYAYQYYNLNGVETMFSPLSDLVNLTDSSENLEVRRYRGGELGKVSGKGVTLSLEGLDTRFDRIRVVRVLYEVYNAPPKVQVFDERAVSTTPVTIMDTGTQILEEMVAEEFTELLIDPIPQTFDSKNSYLFIGNTKEEEFDFEYDASVKRYKTNQETTYVGIDNPFNHLINDTNPDDRYIFHPELQTTTGNPVLGGKGENVEFWFKTERMLIGKEEGLGAPYIKNIPVSQGSYANIKNSSSKIGYQRDEIYRFGLLGFDKKGRNSFVKWVGDLRIPDFNTPNEVFEVGGESQIVHLWSYKKLEISYPNDGFADPDNPEEDVVFNVRILFEKDGEVSSKTLSIPKDISEITPQDLEDLKLQFNHHKPFGTITLDSITSHSHPFLGHTIYCHFEDWTIEGEFGIQSVTELPSGLPATWEIIDKDDYQESEQTINFIEVVNDYSMLFKENGNIYANIVYPVFKVENLPSNIVSYQIVRVERSRYDRTVIDQGICGNLETKTTEPNRARFLAYPSSLSDDQSGSKDIIEYTSAEHLYNNILEIEGERLDFLGRTSFGAMKKAVGHFEEDSNTDSRYCLRSYAIDTYTPSAQSVRFEIEESSNHTPGGGGKSTVDIADLTVYNEVEVYKFETNSDLNNYYGAKELEHKTGYTSRGSCKLLKTSEPLTGSGYSYLARRRFTTYPYGGITVSSLSASTYIPAGDVQKINSIVSHSNKGDIYIGFIETLRGIWSTEGHDFGEEDYTSRRRRRAVLLSFISETTINPDLINAPTINSRTIVNEGAVLHLAMQEEPGVYNAYKDQLFEQDFKLYSYNAIYSQQSNVRKYIPKPLDFTEISHWPTRVHYSDKKVSGEFSDRWTKFRPGNYQDLDTARGPLILLTTFKDNLFFFQKNGIGILGVEQRELVQTDSPGPLIVGTGDVLSQAYYLSSEAGITDHRHVAHSRNIIYFYDSLNKKIGRIVEKGVEFISDTKGISSLIEEAPRVVSVTYNPKYNEVLFSFSSPREGEESFTLVFNEYLDVFTGTYTTYHGLTVLSDQNLFTNYNSTDTKNRLFLDSAEGSNEWYGDTMDRSVLTIVVNPGGVFTCIYDVLEFTLEVLTENGLNANNFVTGVKAYNEYQSTPEFNVDSNNVVQRFRTWRVNALMTDDEARLRSSSLFVDVYYDNTQANKLILHDIVTKFRTNMRYQQKEE